MQLEVAYDWTSNESKGKGRFLMEGDGVQARISRQAEESGALPLECTAVSEHNNAVQIRAVNFWHDTIYQTNLAIH